ncbi:MAG: GCN5-related N-acetyltransferase [Chthonomonadaceae bacterium]|nr:GCN5-related N-acetyltransferase [Chthonomonadaceae bacterium]
MCEHTFLAIFLRDKALAEGQQDLSRTYVLLDTDEPAEESVVGYFTLRADSISYTPAGSRFVSLPVIEIAYLARHIKRKGRDMWGIGPALLVEALRHVESVSQQIGVAAVHLSYTDQGKVLYEDYGFGDHPYGDGWLLLPIADVREALTKEETISID